MDRLTDQQQRQLDAFARRLLDDNARAGLMSSGTDRETIYRRHFEESLAVLEALESRAALASPLIDVGSGGGFPGLVLKIARPELEMTLLEANGKKAAFLESVVEEMAFEGVRVVHQRAEEAGRDPVHRDVYPLALARAVAPLRVLLELTLPLVRPGGLLAAPKGSAADREMAEAAGALAAFDAVIEDASPLLLPGRAERVPTLILVRKHSATPNRYPRRPGIPAKRPL